MTPREIIETAAQALDVYKDPDVTECEELLNLIFVAARLGGISYDTLNSVRFHRGEVYVKTTYSDGRCSQQDSYQFPESIIDAADPVSAATVWGLEKKAWEIFSKIQEIESTLAHYQKELKSVKAELAKHHGT